MSFLGFLAGLMGGLVVFFSGLIVAPQPIADAPDQFIPIATSSPSFLKQTATTSPAKNPPITTTKPLPVPTNTKPVPKPTATTTPAEQPIAEDTLNRQSRAATVNILCRVNTTSGRKIATGSGVFIDSRGVVLTNAHVASYLLYPPGAVSCEIRTGEPAKRLFDADLLYLSPSWAQANAGFFKNDSPKGTGEHDYAFLIPHQGQKIATTSAVVMSTTNARVETDRITLLAAYPAGFLGGAIVERELYPGTSYATIGTLYTFATSSIDLVSLGSSVLAQKGSSGGGVFDRITGYLLGLIVTTTAGETTGDRTLYGVLLSHINRSLEKDAGMSIGAFLEQDLDSSAQRFKETTAPELRKLLEQ